MENKVSINSSTEVFGWVVAGVIGVFLIIGGVFFTSNVPGAFAAKNVVNYQVSNNTEKVVDSVAVDGNLHLTVSEPEPEVVEEVVPEPPVVPADTIYHIERGDTLTRISAITGVSIDRLAEYNSISDPNVIYAEASLRVPFILIPSE